MVKLYVALPVASDVELTNHDITGKILEILIHNNQPSGSLNINFNSIGLPDGYYFYKLKANKQNLVGKMLKIN